VRAHAHKISKSDQRRIERKLLEIEFIFSDYDLRPVDPTEPIKEPSLSWKCLSNGKTGYSEKFQVFDFENGVSIGLYMAKDSCDLAIEKAKESGMTCLSNGKSGYSEKFQVYDVYRSSSVGAYSQKESCLFSIENISSQGLMCLSNGKNSYSEDFIIYDLNREKEIGTWTSQESCQQAIQ